MLFGKGQHTKNAKVIDSTKQLKSYFKGAKCKFSTRMRRTITAYSLAAVGTSDYGIQSVIFGVMKALNDEIGWGMSDEELANGTPSPATLANWEFDLAAGCMATIIHQISIDAQRMMKEYGKNLQLTLVTDHGNRRGVDQFVKQICWSTREGKKYKLRHFNLDIDKGGHTTVDAANAIWKSLQSLHLDAFDVEFSFICGDSAAVGRKYKPCTQD
jgi:hypothetical protein